MGQMGHLWNTSQWEVWMWDLMELTPPKTTAQLGHLESGGEREAKGRGQTAHQVLTAKRNRSTRTHGSSPSDHGTWEEPLSQQTPGSKSVLGGFQFGVTGPAHRWWIQGPGSSSEGAGRDCGGPMLPAMTEV